MPQVYRLNYQPDLDLNWSVNPGVCTDMNGFAPMQNGNISSANRTGSYGFSVTGSDAWRAETFMQLDGTARFLVFRTQNIDEYNSAGTRTNRGTGYSAITTGWDATIWGNQIIAVNYLDSPQSSTGAGFSALGGSPPKARYIASNVNFVVVADVNDGGSNVYTDMVWWSGIRNSASWTPSLATQAGNVRLLDEPGAIKKVVAYKDRFVAFKQNSIFVGQYIGPPYVFSWKVVSATIGCTEPNSVTECDGKLYFYHEGGIYEFDGSNLTNIGRGVIHTLRAGGGIKWARADSHEGIVWFARYATTIGAFTQYTMHLYGYNVRTGLWGKLGPTGQITTSAANAPVQPLVQGTAAEFKAFQNLGLQTSMIWWIDNASSPSFVDGSVGVTALGGSTNFTTGFIGGNDASSTTVRAHVRIVSGGANVVSSGTLSGYPTEYTSSADTTATMSWNERNTTLDGLASGRYKKITINFPSDQGYEIAGMGFVEVGGAYL